MAAHAEVVIATPNRNLSACWSGVRVAVSHGEGAGTAVHRLKNPVRVVHLLFRDLPFEKLVILERDG